MPGNQCVASYHPNMYPYFVCYSTTAMATALLTVHTRTTPTSMAMGLALTFLWVAGSAREQNNGQVRMGTWSNVHVL